MSLIRGVRNRIALVLSAGVALSGTPPLQTQSQNEHLQHKSSVSVMDPHGDCTVKDAPMEAGFTRRKLYEQHHETICKAALQAGIDPILLAITVQHEGERRAIWSSSSAGKAAEFLSWDLGPNSTVGDIQMLPRNAVVIMQAYFQRTISEKEAAYNLIYSPDWAIYIAAYYLKYIQEVFALSDRQAFVAYAFNLKERYCELMSYGFQGNESLGRWEKFGTLYSEIISAGFDPTMKEVPGSQPEGECLSLSIPCAPPDGLIFWNQK